MRESAEGATRKQKPKAVSGTRGTLRLFPSLTAYGFLAVYWVGLASKNSPEDQHFPMALFLGPL